MATSSHSEAALEDSEPTEHGVWSPQDAMYLRFRLRAIARSRPSAVIRVLDYWLGTPTGESEFDVRG